MLGAQTDVIYVGNKRMYLRENLQNSVTQDNELTSDELFKPTKSFAS